MCIIIAKDKGISIPDRTILKNCFDNNPDGAGIMWNESEFVHIQKGFMLWKDFDEFLNSLSKRIDLKLASVVMHFRITTHGRTSPQNCHPFPISTKARYLKTTSFKTAAGVCHNGIIPIKCAHGLSDTQTYILKRMSKLKSKFYNNPRILKQIENEIQSKMCLLSKDGRIHLIGNFIKDNGIFYSNHSYKSYIDSYYDYFNFDYSFKLLCPVCGYIINNDGLLCESSDFEYLIDSSGNVYKYDFCFDSAISLDNARAYNHYGIPFRFDENSAMFIEVI